MKISLTSVLVDDQDKALRFYTEVLGFVKKMDMPAGKFKWLAVVSPQEPDTPYRERASGKALAFIRLRSGKLVCHP